MNEFIDNASPTRGVTKYNRDAIKFHVFACFHRGRSKDITLRAIARNYGWSQDVMQLASDRYDQLAMANNSRNAASS